MNKTPKILIVEDELFTAEAISILLKHIGYDPVATVTSGREALDKIEELEPDVVLMDIIIEGDLDGIETAKQVQQQFDIPVIFITAHGDEKTLNDAIATSPYGYLIKPINVEHDIKPAIEIALKKHEAIMDLKQKEKILYDIESIMQYPATEPRLLLKGDETDKKNPSLKSALGSPHLVNWAESLGNKERLKILSRLLKNRLLFDDICKIIEKSPSTASHHLGILQDHYFIIVQKQGRFSHYLVNGKLKIDKLFDMIETDDLERLFSSLANQERVVILSNLLEHDLKVNDLEKMLGKSPTTISHHVKILQDAQLVTFRKDGRFLVYSINKEPLKRLLPFFNEYYSFKESEDTH